MIGVRDEYEPKFGRQQLTLWSGGFASVYEGSALELPNHDGFMVTLSYSRGKIRVECPAPRTDDNFIKVDEAIDRVIAAHLEEDEVDDDPLCGLCGQRRPAPGFTACSTCA